MGYLQSYLAPPSSRAIMFPKPRGLRGLAALRIRGLRGLGSGAGGSWDQAYPSCTDIDPSSGSAYGTEGSYCTSPQPANGPIPIPLQNIITAAQAPQDPLSYVSPQAAIAAGLDSNTVYAAWTQGMAAFPTAQAAVAAGVPAGVVTQLFAASRAYVTPAQPSWLVQNWPILAAGAGLLLLLGKRR